jgi:hypothetical protein
LIYACYVGGACGYAVRYILLLSPDMERQHDRCEQRVRYDGAAHGMISRCGLIRNNGMDPHNITLNDLPTDIGLPDTETWWMMEPPPRLIRHAQRVIDNSITFDGRFAAEWREWKRWVWVDHVPPRAARMLFPNAKILLLSRDWKSSYRDYAIKNMFQPAHYNTVKHGIKLESGSSIDVQLRSSGREPTRHAYKEDLLGSCVWASGQHDLLSDPAYSEGAFVVDVDRLLDPGSWREEYDRMVSYCELTPDYEATEAFIREYAANQPRRGRWRPDPSWEWVKSGPNRPGRW